MTSNSLTIVSLTQELMHIHINGAREEAWNPGIDDQTCFYAADNDGFLAGYLNQVPIACISAVNYSNLFGFIGFYIVAPEHRGKGFGRQIWNAALDKLKGIDIGLDGVVAQQDFYRRSGFHLKHRNIRFFGIAKAFTGFEQSVISLSEQHFPMLHEYDKKHFGYPRPDFLQAWISQSSAIAKLIIIHGEIKGFGLIRKCYSGYKIGPLFADSYDYADAILRALQNSIPEGETYFLDIPEPNAMANKLTKAYNMSAVFETARMYKGNAPRLPLDNIYGITSFELG